MRKILLFFFVTIILTFSSFAQSASAVWILKTNQSSTVTGNVTATSQQLINMQATLSNSGGDTVVRTSPTPTAGTWPAQSTEDPTRYMQFSVSPAAGYLFTANSLSMILYANSGSSMRANVYYSKDSTFSTRTQVGGTFSLTNTILSSPNVTAAPGVSVSSGETFYVRVYPWYTSSTTGKYLIAKTVIVSGTANAMSAVFASVTDLNGFFQTDATPSTLQSYTLTGTNLTNNVVVTPPSNFEVSTDAGSTWHNNSSPVILPQSGGIITGQPVIISVRMNAGVAGSYSDTIKHTSSGAQQTVVLVNGARITTEPTAISTVSFGTVTGSSMVVNFTGGNGAKRVVIARKDSAVSWTPTDGVSTLGINSDFSAALNQGGGNKAVYDGAGTSVTVTGLISNGIYHFAVYEYNTAGGNSQNYLTSSAGTGHDTTLAVAYLLANPASVAFGSGVINKDTIIKNYSLSGLYLTGSGYISITVPAGGFAVSLLSNSGYSTSVQVPFSSGTLSAVSIYVRFIPVDLTTYSDTVTNSGGGVTSLKVPLSGKGISGQVDINFPVGFATLGSGTTGGAGGTTVTVTDAAQLAEIMRLREKGITTPLIINISGTLTGYTSEISCKRTSNISIIGLGNDAGFLGFGMKIWTASNIIVRNLKFADCTAGEGDGMSVDECNNVWVDHCTFTDSPSSDPNGSDHDGALDCKNGSYNITFSYNHFMNHHKTCLMGHTPDQTSDTVMKVTYYRNWFEGTYSRHPRVRFGKAHVLNNFYSSVGVGGGYAVGVTCISQVALESNYFENTLKPTLISQVNDPGGTLSGDPAGFLKSTNNCTTGSGAIVENLSGYNFDPHNYYDYVAGDCSQIKSIVTENAGSGIINTNPNTTFNLSVTALLEAMYVSGGTEMTMTPSVTVELHDGTTKAVVESKTEILNTSGVGTFNFTTVSNATPYYIVVKSANTVETWSATAQSFTSGSLTYDFTTGLDKAYTDGSNPSLVVHGGKYCFYSGDVNQDGFVTGDDFQGVDNDAANFEYHAATDVNGDGFVTGDDFQFIDNNASLFVQRQVPPGAPGYLAKPHFMSPGHKKLQ